MTIHNYAEEEVLAKVEEIFSAEEGREKMRFCTCEYCRADVACYVLNRMPPLYQTSSRGLTHRELDYQEKLQREADMVALVYRGIERITETQRPHGYKDGASSEEHTAGAFYNAPQIIGRIFHSTSFEPMKGIEVRLLSDDGLEVQMTDSRWKNPCLISDSTPGVFSFWPIPQKAAEVGSEKSLGLKISVDAAAFEPLRHYFNITLVSEDGYLRFSSGNRVFNLPDLFFVPR